MCVLFLKRRFLVASSCSALCLANVCSAAVLDSSSFNHKYEGDVVPVVDSNGVATPTYDTGATPTGGVPVSDGDILTYQNSVGSGNGYWESNGSIWEGGVNPVSDGNGWTIEMRVKINDDVAEAAAGTLQIFARDGDGKRYVLVIGKNSTSYGSSSGNVVIDNASNTDGFHTFRIAQDAGGSVTSIWRDGVEILSDVSDFTSDGGAAYMFFGDGTGALGGPTVNIDYFRWDSTGAYDPIPIPEPASVGMIALGLFVMLKHRGHVI